MTRRSSAESIRRARRANYEMTRDMAMVRDGGRCIYPGAGKFRCGKKADGGIDHLTGRLQSALPDFGNAHDLKNLAASCMGCHSNKTFEKVRDVLLFLKKRYGYDYAERRYRKYHLNES